MAYELLAAVVADVFPEWAERVREHVASATDPGEQVWRYVEINLELFAGSEQSVAQALTRVVDPRVLQGPMEEFHAQLQVPLRGALAAFGEPDTAASRVTDAATASAFGTLTTRASVPPLRKNCWTPKLSSDSWWRPPKRRS